ncbi:MAG TPA: DinB family protein [Melioribacteraceae bacterium]|mgnify:CR=1 FL=1|nr:DinB family protein [Melioribacteraceae bacterium]
MATKSEILKSMWAIARHNLVRLSQSVTKEHMNYKLHPMSNSLGFLMLHIAEVEIVFGNFVFGFNYPLKSKTFKKEEGVTFDNLEETLEMLNKVNLLMEEAIGNSEEDSWEKIVKTPIGEFTKYDAIARIIAHTSYHSGQIGLILKYGNN